jgi:excinuclease ABC subunit C
LMQRVFRFRTCSLEISAADDRRRFNRPCLLYYIDRCLGPCAARVSLENYTDQIDLLINFLEGKRTRVLKALKDRMKERSDATDYETAAVLRDEIRALDALSHTGDIVSFPEAFAAPVADFQQGLLELQHKLNLAQTPRRVDGVDVAVIRGHEAVGSIVTFVDGKPFKPGYRRFKIKSAQTNDDYAMISEVIERRFTRLEAEEEPFPDIQLIDGGLGHIDAVLAQFRAMNMKPPVLLALAKQEEIVRCSIDAAPPIVVPGLPRTSLALRVLQRVRDESHRFAQHYHHLLRSKALHEDEGSPVNVGVRKRAARKTPPNAASTPASPETPSS